MTAWNAYATVKQFESHYLAVSDMYGVQIIYKFD